MAPSLPNLFFVPGLHRFTAARGSYSSHPAPVPRAFCPSASRHALVTPPTPSRTASARRLNPPRGRRAAPPPQAIVAPAPAGSPVRSTLQTPPSLAPQAPPPPLAPVDSTRSVGHKHTAESKRKISVANRGNVPWNKGRKHSEETKRKISEATKRAMLQPEMRRLLKERAKGRRHSEATKLKIRETARASRGAASTLRKPKKQPVPFSFPAEVVADLNAKVQHQLENAFKLGDSDQLVVREKRPMREETKAKLSARIKELWSDPEYRTKVAEGMENRAQRLGTSKSQSSSPTTSTSTSPRRTTARKESSPQSKSPRRKARSESPENPDTDITPFTSYEDIDSSEIFLQPESLDGITKDDLGLLAPHAEGQIDVTASKDSAFTNASRENLPSPMLTDTFQGHHDFFDSFATAENALDQHTPCHVDVYDHQRDRSKLELEFANSQPYLLDLAQSTRPFNEFARSTLPGPSYQYDSARPQFLGLFDMPPVQTMSSYGADPPPFPYMSQASDMEGIPQDNQFNVELSNMDRDQVMSYQTGTGSAGEEEFTNSANSTSNISGGFE